MKKIRLTEEQFIEYLAKSLCESFLQEKGSEGKGINAFAQRRATDVINQIKDKAGLAGYDSDSDIMKLADEYGINPDSLRRDFDKQKYMDYRKKEIDRLQKDSKEINKWICKYIDQLRACCAGESFMRDKDSFKIDKDGNMHTHNTGDTPMAFDKIKDQKTRANVLRLKDFLDKIGLSCLYRDAPAPKGYQKKYGVESLASLNKNTSKKEIMAMDFMSASDDELYDFYSSGTRYDTINKDAAANSPGFDIKDSKRDTFNAEENAYVKVAAKVGLLKQRCDRYLDRTYGVTLDFGENNDMFKFGNAKIHDDTLIVNFESAFRCPAWNECILKDACYAKASEVGYDNTLSSNLKKGFIWSQTKEDKGLMDAMCVLIRSCMFDYTSAWPKISALKTFNDNKEYKQRYKDALNAAPSEKVKGVRSQKTEQGALMLAKMTFSDIQREFGDEAIDILKNGVARKTKEGVSMIKKGSVIRLNENGDFIGQWLVDAWEKIAEDFKIVDVRVAAYTCRALNYTNVKNLILNISQASLVNNQESEGFAHFFYAISHRDYNDFPDTYNGKDHSLNIDQETFKITPVYRNLINEEGNLVGYYYKCPCGRGKRKYIPVEATNQIKKNAVAYDKMPSCLEGGDKYINVNGEYFQSVENKDITTKADCYMCRICYGRNEDADITVEGGGKPQPGLPIFALVATHGTNQDDSKGINTNDYRRILGKPITYWTNLIKNQKHVGVQVNPEVEPAFSTINEEMTGDLNQGANDDEVINQITKNMTYSVANMMTRKLNRVNEIKNNFNKTLKMLEEY